MKTLTLTLTMTVTLLENFIFLFLFAFYVTYDWVCDWVVLLENVVLHFELGIRMIVKLRTWILKLRTGIMMLVNVVEIHLKRLIGHFSPTLILQKDLDLESWLAACKQASCSASMILPC